MVKKKQHILDLIAQAISHQRNTDTDGNHTHVVDVLEVQRVATIEEGLEWSDDDIARLSQMTDSPIETPLWKLEHGSDYAVPGELLDLVEKGVLEDTSYRHDTCPRFRKGEDLDVWVEHPNPEMREIAGKRFMVVRDPEGDCDTVLETDDITEVLQIVSLRLGKKIGELSWASRHHHKAVAEHKAVLFISQSNSAQ